MTPEKLAELQRVNDEVNAIPYEDVVGPHEAYDWWTDTPVEGQSWECRDYTLAKADRLRSAGWDYRTMHVVLLWTEPVGDPPAREYHAVLAVDDPDGGSQLILDNRAPQVYRMDTPPFDYQWSSIQVAGGTTFEAVA